jgi:hypothetical protein
MAAGVDVRTRVGRQEPSVHDETSGHSNAEPTSGTVKRQAWVYGKHSHRSKSGLAAGTGSWARDGFAVSRI